MIEKTMDDGRMLREFVDGRFLEEKVGAAVRDSETKEVRVVKVGRNEPCPCGSGRKFKKCCLWKVGCGAEVVTWFGRDK